MTELEKIAYAKTYIEKLASKFPEATIADAILDRIVHDSYTIEIRGADDRNQKSMREIYGVGSK